MNDARVQRRDKKIYCDNETNSSTLTIFHAGTRKYQPKQRKRGPVGEQIGKGREGNTEKGMTKNKC